MKKQKVLSYKNLPTRLPITSTIAFYLLLDKFQVTDLVWGIFWTLVIILWLGSMYLIFSAESPVVLWGEEIKK